MKKNNNDDDLVMVTAVLVVMINNENGMFGRIPHPPRQKKLPQSYRRQVGLLMYLHDRTPPGHHHHECHPHYWQSNPLKYHKK